MTSIEPVDKLLVFGGTFDPPHIGHLVQADRVRQRLGFDRVLFVPTGQSPHKRNVQSTDAALRLAMVEAAIADWPHASVCDWELHRPPPSYTVDTLEQIVAALPETSTVRLLIGADQARMFEKWHRADRIEQIAEPVVMVRPPDDVTTLAKVLPERFASRLIAIEPMDISATEIRQAVAQGSPTLASGQVLSDWLSPAVLAIVEKHGLYRS